MKNFFLAAALAVLTSAPGMAQTAHPAMSPATQAQLQRVHAQMMQAHQKMRADILAALTPAHRALLASIAGQLATSANPDTAAAAKRLDATLSATEKQKILAAAKAMHDQMMAMMKSMPKPPGDDHHMGVPRMMERHGPSHEMRMRDAGWILLEMAGGHGDPHDMHP